MLIRVNSDGTLTHVKKSTVKPKETEVYLILDTAEKKILLFAGENATVSHKFLGLKTGKKLKKSLKYTLLSDKKDRSQFDEALKKEKELIKKKKKPPASVIRILDNLNTKLEEEEKIAQQGSSSLEEILEQFDSEPHTEGLVRDYIITKDRVYATTDDNHDVAELPDEGIFTADNYIPRVLIRNKEVVAIELLRKAE